MANERQTPLNKAEKFQRKLGRKHKGIKHDERYDKALLIAYQNGDEDAGWELFESYVDVASIVYKFPSKPPHKTEKMKKLHYQALTVDDKEDLFQEIAYHFFKLAKEFDGELGKFEHMVRAKLHQRVFNNFFSEFISVETNETKFDDDLEVETDGADIFLNEKTKKLPNEYLELYHALNQLSSNQRDVLIFSVAKGWNSREIAEELNLSHDNVRKLLSRGMKRMKEIMIKTEEA